MKLVITITTATALLVAGCGGNATGSTGGGTSSADSNLTLDAVASVACNGAYQEQKKSDLDWFASSGATCGRTQVSMFDSPGARDNWTSVAKANGRVVVGSNWAVLPANDTVAQRVQDKLGGTVYGGF